MYRIDARVRYSEVGRNKTVSMSQIVNYFQDCSTFNSEDIGMGLEHLEERNRAWLLSSWQIVMERYPAFGETISIGTWPYDMKGMYGYRNFDIIDQKGIRIGSANSIWFFMDTQLGRPVRITEEEVQAYGNEERLPMDYAPRKIITSEDAKVYDSFQIRKMHIDTNNHVNNGKYIEIAEEFLPKAFEIKQMRADYKKSALLYDTIIPKRSICDKKCIIELCDVDEKPYVIVEFTCF